ncbi:MAG TPA: hypothetical protein VE978_25555 [Chitinophagales bacterium]|nr:hypothetical protein [Chitinophagales bacterium]
MTKSGSESLWKSPANAILASWLVAGTLDVTTAIVVYSLILHKASAIKILQGIASGIYGKDSYSGGVATAMVGLAFHYLIAFSFAILYFLIFPKLAFLKKNWIISGLLYGLFVWLVMNLLVIRLVFPAPKPITWESFLIGATILMIMIGLPMSFITNKHYALREKIT